MKPGNDLGVVGLPLFVGMSVTVITGMIISLTPGQTAPRSARSPARRLSPCRASATAKRVHTATVFPELPSPHELHPRYKVGGARLPQATVIASFAADARTITK
jgi:hypothetical protein